MKKKILAVFLSLCMAMSLLPVTALAAETGENTPSTQAATELPAAENGVITLKQDVTLKEGTERVSIDTSVNTIDLNGHTLTALISVSGNLTIKDGSENRNGKVTSTGNPTVLVNTTGNLTLDSGTIETTGKKTSTSAPGAIYNTGSITINYGTVTGVYGIRSGAQLNGELLNDKVSLTINGGTVHGDDYGIYTFGRGITEGGVTTVDNSQVSLTITGGRVECGEGKAAIGTNASSGKYAGYTFEMTGGEVDGSDTGTGLYLPAIGVNNISGGTITGAQAIRIAAGELNITGGQIISTDNNTDDIIAGGTGGASGSLVIGKASTGYVGNLVVNVSGRAKLVNETEGGNPTAVFVTDKTMNNPSYDDVVIEVNIEDIEITGDILRVSDLTNGGEKEKAKGSTTSLNISNVTVTGDVVNQSTNGDVGISGSTIAGNVTNKSKGEVVIENHSTITGTVSNEGAEGEKGFVAILDSTVTRAIDDAEGNNITIVNSIVNGTETNNTGNNVAMIGATPYETLENAITAAKDGDTITLLKDANLNADITIRQNITIDGQDKHKIGAQPQKSHAITVASNAALTLENVALNITNGDVETGSYGLNVQYGATLTLDNADVTLAGLSNATISSNPNSAGTEPGKFVLTNGSAITANDIGGNFSNGGTWTIGTGSKVTIDGCASHGFSASAIIVENGATVDIKNVAYRGISINDAGGKLEIQAGGVVNVTNAGTDDSDAYDAVYLSKNATAGLQIAEGAILNVTAGENGNDRIELSEEAVSASKLNGTIIGTVKLPENSTSYVVTYVSNNQQITTTIADKDTPIRLLNALPNQGYNHFVGWKSSVDGKTYQPGAEVPITANTIFTAVWSYIPPANPNYRIDIPAAEGGTVTADPAAAKAGATVTLTATPDEGYAVGTITVTDRFGDAVKVTENADGTYTFTMPNGQVTVKATFVETEEPAPAEPFPDVDENDWFYDEVVYVYENGLMNGVENNQFAPNTATNRAMLATILYRLAGEPAVSGDLPFTDVESGTWYTDAVLWAAQNGIVNGLGENTFAPMNTLTREQLVTMLYRYAEAKGYDVSASADLSGYPDAGQVQDYAQPAMAWAVAENIIQGMEDGTLKPAGNASRAQIATILMRFCEDVAQ